MSENLESNVIKIKKTIEDFKEEYLQLSDQVFNSKVEHGKDLEVYLDKVEKFNIENAELVVRMESRKADMQKKIERLIELEKIASGILPPTINPPAEISTEPITNNDTKKE